MRSTSLACTVALLLALVAPAAMAQDTPVIDKAPRTPAISKLTTDFGFVQTSGNTQVTTMNIGERFTHERGRFTLSQTFALVYGKQRDTLNTNNLRTSLRGDYKIDKVFAFFLGAGYDRNRFAGIERRFEEQIGLQARVLAASADTIRIEGGGSVTQQIAVSGVQENFPSARGALAWRHAFTQSSYFNQNVEYVPNLIEHADWRLNTESSLIAPLSSRLGLKLSYVVRYDNLPEPGFERIDKLFTTGIQLTF